MHFLTIGRRLGNTRQHLPILLIVLFFSGTECWSWSDFQEAHARLAHAVEVQRSKGAEKDLKTIKESVVSASQQIESLLNRGIITYLENGGSSSGLQRKLQAALQVGRDSEQLAFVLPLGAGSRQILVGYTIPYCATCARSWMGVLGRVGNRIQILSELKDPMPNQTLNIMEAGTTGIKNPFVLAYGTNLGDAHSRLNAELYCFCNGELKRVWTKTGLPQGTVSVSNERLTLSYLSSLQPPWIYKTEVYTWAPNGLEFSGSTQQPAH